MIEQILRILNPVAIGFGLVFMLYCIVGLFGLLLMALRDAIENWRRRLRERRCDRWWRENKRSAAYHRMLDDMWGERDLHVVRHYDSVDHLLETLR